MSEDSTSEDSTRGQGFDELARAVADGSLNRRRALKLFAGTAIASLIPSRALADDDDHDDDDDECFVPVCHVPFDRVTGVCDEANARTLFVRRRKRRRHLKNHRCDRKGKCPRSTRSTTTTLLGGTTSTTTTLLGGTTSTTTTLLGGTTSTTTTPLGGTSSTTSSTTTSML